jgi:hypothetical protein
MEESGSDKISNAWEVFVMMIEKSDYARFRNIPDTIGVRKHAFGFIDDEIICSFFQDRNIKFWCFLENNRRKVSF